MGLFDTIYFEAPLPDFPDKIEVDGINAPQTKSLFCMLETYFVRDSKLYTKNGKRFLFHGDIELTCVLADSLPEERKLVYYIARFTEGELQWIKREGDVEYEVG